MSSHSSSKKKRKYVSESVISDRDAKSDTDGIISYSKGDIIYDRYKIIEECGQGTFGTVLYCYDTLRKQKVAIKAVRSVRRFLKAAHAEIRILEKIFEEDFENNSLCVKIKKSFSARFFGRRHHFIVFKKLGCSLYDFIVKNGHKGFSLSHVREFAFQILTAVRFCHSIDLVHTDLKPENILLVNDEHYTKKTSNSAEPLRVPRDTQIRLIDFGGATFINEHHTRIINTRQYRAPEVILGLGWGFASDMWSVGCIISELYTGQLLFGTHENAEHLAMMERVLGKRIPNKMAQKAKILWEENKSRRERSKRRHRQQRSTSSLDPKTLFAAPCNRLDWPAVARDRARAAAVRNVLTVRHLGEASGDPSFADLLGRLLVFEPEKRMSAGDALKHSFFDSLK